MDWASQATNLLWHNSLAALPLVLMAAAATHLLRCRPATRHTMWLMVLLWLVLPPLLPGVSTPTASLSPSSPLTRGGLQAGLPHSSATSPDHSFVRRGEKKSINLGRNDTRPRSSAGSYVRAERRHTKGAVRSRVNRTNKRFPATVTPPSPRLAARAASHVPEMLAQVSGVAGLLPNYCPADPIVERKATTVGPFCPAAYGWRPEHVAVGTKRLAKEQATTPTRQRLVAGNEPTLAAVVTESNPSKSAEPSFWAIVAEKVTRGSREWLDAFVGVRNAITRIPPLPTNIWIGGTVAILLWCALRVVEFRRRLRRATSAPRTVRRMVVKACRTLGVRRVPEVLMLDDCVSPMVFCGVRPRLVLPVRLWDQLDDVGRRAVIFHELAHVRRLDHWVQWAEGIVGSVFWWNPLVWWVRHRLHLEAENCCDAWVTTLLPRTRRAYAEALIKARQYLNEGNRSVPAMGMGVTTGRAKRFARRLTMVMTTSSKPRISASGVTLVLMIAVTGWLASPVRSCPPHEEKAKKCDDAKPKLVIAAPAVVKPDTKTTYERYVKARGEGSLFPTPKLAGASLLTVADGPKDAKKIRKLERQLEKLGRQLERLARQMDDGDDDRDDRDERAERKERRARKERKDRTKSRRTKEKHAYSYAPKHGHGPHDFAVVAPVLPIPPSPPLPPIPPVLAFAPRADFFAQLDKGDKIWRTYKLSEGKMKPFTTLMSRDDVPIFVRPGDGSIEISATKRQHGVFNAFFQMIDPSDDRVGFGFGVPSMFFSGDNVRLFTGAGSGCGGGCSKCGSAGGCKGCAQSGCAGCSSRSSGCGKCRKAAEGRARARELRDDARARVTEIRARAEGEAARIQARAIARIEESRERVRRHARSAHADAKGQRDVSRELQNQAEQLRRQAERLREQAERIHEEAERVREQASEESESAAPREAYQHHAQVLQQNVEQLHQQAEQVDRQAHQLDEQMQAIEADAEELQGHAERLNERAESIEDAKRSLDEVGITAEMAQSVVALVAQIEQMAPEAVEAAAARLAELPAMTETVGALLKHALEPVNSDELEKTVIQALKAANGEEHEKKVDDGSEGD